MTVFNKGDFVQVWWAELLEPGVFQPFIDHGKYGIVLESLLNDKAYLIHMQDGTKRRTLAKNLRKAIEDDNTDTTI